MPITHGALGTQSRQLLRQAWQDDAGSLSAQHYNGLLRERLSDVACPRLIPCTEQV